MAMCSVESHHSRVFHSITKSDHSVYLGGGRGGGWVWRGESGEQGEEGSMIKQALYR